MIKVKFRTNLGSRDAGQLGLDYTACLVGEEVEVGDKTAEKLESLGLCEPISRPKPKKIKAVPTAAKVRGVPEGEEFLKDSKATDD